MSRVPGIADKLTPFHAFSYSDGGTVFFKVVVLAGCSVLMQDDDEIGEFATTAVPTAPGVSLDYPGDNSGARRVDRRAFRHVEVNGELLQPGMTEAGTKALQHAI